jgi:hypothetical protein
MAATRQHCTPPYTPIDRCISDDLGAVNAPSLRISGARTGLVPCLQTLHTHAAQKPPSHHAYLHTPYPPTNRGAPPPRARLVHAHMLRVKNADSKKNRDQMPSALVGGRTQHNACDYFGDCGEEPRFASAHRPPCPTSLTKYAKWFRTISRLLSRLLRLLPSRPYPYSTSL